MRQWQRHKVSERQRLEPIIEFERIKPRGILLVEVVAKTMLCRGIGTNPFGPSPHNHTGKPSNLISPLCLAICLRVIGTIKLEVSSYQSKKLIGKQKGLVKSWRIIFAII